MSDATPDPEPRSAWARFVEWAGRLLLILALLVGSVLLAEIPAVHDLAARIDRAGARYPWLIAIPIALMAVGALLMLIPPFLPGRREAAPPSDEALDAAAVPMEYAEVRGHWSAAVEMEAGPEQVREAWRRRSWRYSPRWRAFLLMLLGAVLLATGITALFVLIGPAFLKLLIVALFAYTAVRILREFTAG